MAKRSKSSSKSTPRGGKSVKPLAKAPAISPSNGTHAIAKKGRAQPPAPAGPDPVELAELRQKIDAIDRKLVDLLNSRAALVVEVGKVKRATGVPVYAPHREAQVLNKVIGHNKGPLPDRTIEGVYRELMSGSFRLELPMRVGYLGPPGSYSHLAAVKQFGTSVDFEDLRAIAGVFNEVARGHVDCGLVPIENSIGGGIAETLSALEVFHAQVNVYAEVQIEVHHALLANCPPSAVKRIYSKPEVFTQCRTWLATQYPQAQLVAEASSSRAVQIASEAGPQDGIAAIGSKLAADIYGVTVLFENIEDTTSNITRFYVISRQKAQQSQRNADNTSNDKTAIMFSTQNTPGALVDVLAVFQRAGINLSHIDKRPSGRVNWQYTFFIDADGHVDDPWFAAAVQQAKGLCRELHVLGSFPRSKRIL
ncbi:MAG: prephenate dehydratase [Phycisphaerales bacterium]|nr:prephenate dehydratase [Phycisphaerales bacterium]